MHCADCHAPIDGRTTACPRCGAPVGPQASPKVVSAVPRPATPVPRWWFGVAGILVLVLCCVGQRLYENAEEAEAAIREAAESFLRDHPAPGR